MASDITTALEQKYWDTKLYREVQSDDIFSPFTGMIKNYGDALPSSIIVQTFQSGKATGTVGLVKELVGAGISGDGALAGNEEDMIFRDHTVNANEFKHGVNTEKFGLQAVKNSPYGVRGLANPLLITYMQKNLGMHRRQGLVQGYSANLTASPTSLTQYLNSNFYVGGVAETLQPAYVDTLATYATAINTAIPDSPTAAHRMTKANVKKLEEHVRTSAKIKPLKGGRYIVTVPSGQAATLMDETTGLLQTFIGSSSPNKSLAGWIGSFGTLDFIEDLKSPVLLAADGTSAVLVWTYIGASDSRPAIATDQWDVGFVLGEGSVIELVLEKQHFETNNFTNYGQDERLGAFADYGVNLLEFQDGADAKINSGSIVCLWNRNE